MRQEYDVIVIGGGHAGVEAAWAAANILRRPGCVALVTLDPSKIGEMSCNPAIGGLAKGQLVREVDAMGGLMGLAADATGIQFKVLNRSRGAAVHGPRAQCDKHAYARQVRAMIAARPEIEVIGGSVERVVVEGGRAVGVQIAKLTKQQSAKGPDQEGVKGPSSQMAKRPNQNGPVGPSGAVLLSARAVVLTTGTFMRGLMHTGEARTPGGRHGEGAAHGISDALRAMGFELGRLKTGTPPRLKRGTIRWDELEPAMGDAEPVAFSDLSAAGPGTIVEDALAGASGSSVSPGCLRGSVPSCLDALVPSCLAFPVLPQVDCRETSTTAEVHAIIRANLHRAPMYSGQIESVGPRYCPSIEDKVVRFADRESHTVFLEPESLESDWIYCNGISTSLPADVQEAIVRSMPGCEVAHVYRHGYAVEYDMVRPHQIHATGMTKLVEGLFLAGQINGTSGYEEAAAQGLVAGVNAARLALGLGEFTLGREQAYIGVLMDDLVTKTPVEPYRMFTSRAEHRLLLRPDNAAERLTPIAMELGLLGPGPDGGRGCPIARGDAHEDGDSAGGGLDKLPSLGAALAAMRRAAFARRREGLAAIHASIRATSIDGVPAAQWCRRAEFTEHDLRRAMVARHPSLAGLDPRLWLSAHADHKYEPYVERQRRDIERHAELEHRRLPQAVDYAVFASLRPEARQALARFRPSTFGQAGRLEGVTPADLTLLAVLVGKKAVRGK